MMNLGKKDDLWSQTLNQADIKLEKVEIPAVIDKKYSPWQDQPEKKKCRLNQPQTERDFLRCYLWKKKKKELTDTDKVYKVLKLHGRRSNI